MPKVNSQIAFFQSTLNQESSSYQRSVGLTALISASLDKKCELIDFGLAYSGRPLSHNKIGALIQKIFSKFAVTHRIKKYVKSHEFEAIFTVFHGIAIMNWLKRECKKRKITLVCDFCEWVVKEQFKLKGLSHGYIVNNYAMTKWIDSETNVIGISSFLVNYFTSKGATSLRVPDLFDSTLYKYCSVQKNNKCVLLFVGNKTRKDSSDRFVEALHSLPSEHQKRVHAIMIGCAFKNNVNSNVNERFLSDLLESKTLTLIDYLPYKEFEKLYEKCAFSCFFYYRDERNAKALFPTKLLDAFKHSRPIITNLANDIGLYVFDSQNGLISSSNDVEDIKVSLIRAVETSFLNLEQMSVSAFRSAKEYFDINAYKESFITFYCSCAREDN